MRPYRFLLIDDDPAVLRILGRIVAEEGLGTVAGAVRNGVEAESTWRTLDPDIVIVDLLMPQVDGLETMRRLRAQGFSGKFVVLSQVTDKEMVAAAYQAGVEFYITKPINRIETVGVLRRVVEHLRVTSILGQIRNSLTQAEPRTLPEAAAGAGPGPRTAPLRRNRAEEVLADLGILGEAGATDLLLLAEVAEREPMLPLPELKTVYRRLVAAYAGRKDRSQRPEAVEQRLRRSAAVALSHVAAIGLEDYGNPRFEHLAPRFFDFQEVRVEMQRLRRGAGPPGRVNLKKFLGAFLLELEREGWGG